LFDGRAEIRNKGFGFVFCDHFVDVNKMIAQNDRNKAVLLDFSDISR